MKIPLILKYVSGGICFTVHSLGGKHNMTVKITYLSRILCVSRHSFALNSIQMRRSSFYTTFPFPLLAVHLHYLTEKPPHPPPLTIRPHLSFSPSATIYHRHSLLLIRYFFQNFSRDTNASILSTMSHRWRLLYTQTFIVFISLHVSSFQAASSVWLLQVCLNSFHSPPMIP